MTPIFEVARVTLTFTSPMVVGTGSGDDVADAACVTDANGLPTIPGTSIAGVLVAAGLKGIDGADRRSPVTVSWAAAHDQTDTPVPATGASDDPVLRLLRAGIVRHHVRIGSRGVAEKGGKFGERLVPAGARFTFELRCDHGGPSMQQVLQTLARPEVTLGAGASRGLGAFTVQARGRRFDLRRDWSAWAQHPVSLRARDHLPVLQVAAGASTMTSWTLLLEAQDLVVVGGGTPDPDRSQDILALREPRVVWRQGQGAIDHAWPLPGSSIKGALRHRTRFWLNARAPQHADELDRALFGAARGDDDEAPGALVVPEATLHGVPHTMDHVRLDRFTMAPIDGALFSESALLVQEPLELRVALRRDVPKAAELAFQRALDDLCEGTLALGGGANRGHGYFTGGWK